MYCKYIKKNYSFTTHVLQPMICFGNVQFENGSEIGTHPRCYLEGAESARATTQKITKIDATCSS